MFRFVLILTLAVVAYGRHLPKHGNHHTKLSNKIVGGEETTIEKHPYQVFLLTTDNKNREYTCGGSILNSRWILTAAHCLRNIVRIKVRAGSSRQESGGKVFHTTTFRSHPSYDHHSKDYDVGLVQLVHRPLPLNNETMKAVTLAEEGSVVAPGTPVTVSGWGVTEESASDSAEVLMDVKIEIFETEKCEKAYNPFTTRMICAGVPGGGKDSCQGDSGGPLVTDDDVQVGIVSFGIGCARPDYPGVYSNVSSIRSWIRTNSGV